LGKGSGLGKKKKKTPFVGFLNQGEASPHGAAPPVGVGRLFFFGGSFIFPRGFSSFGE